MAARPDRIFKILVALLSVVFAVLLFPAIVDQHGFWMSLLYTTMGICVIWLAYFGIGKLIDWIVNEELKRRVLRYQNDKSNKLQDNNST